MKEKKKVSRRSFIQKSAGAAALLSIPTIIPANVFGANDKIRVAVLGVNGRGTNHIQGFSNLPDVEVACLCDPDLVVLAKRAKEFETKYSRQVIQQQDLRKVFEDKSIDAVRAHDKSILNAPVETAHLASGLAHLGNIAYRTGCTLNFDPKTEKFINDDEANTYLTRPARKPFEVPEKV